MKRTMNKEFNIPGRPQNAFAALRRFVPRDVSEEHCELCSLVVSEPHPHLVELANRRIVCACDSCAILFTEGATKYKRIPRDARRLGDFELSDQLWESLAIPIGLAFFFYKSEANGPVISAFYPSPAGATESLLDLAAWNEIVIANPAINKMQPDVEALLVNRIGNARDYYVAPIDECYRLVGVIRSNWKGLSGGADVWNRIELFFHGLKAKTNHAAA